MTVPARRVAITLASLSALAILLAILLVRRGFELTPVRGAPPFDLDEPAPSAR